MAQNPYSLIQNTKYKRYDDRGHITPNFEYSEGIRPTGEYMPAPYLPAVRFNIYFEEYFVLSGGKVVAFDSNGNIVPAGYRLEAAAYKAEFDANGQASADALATIRYADADVGRGVLNAAGQPVQAGEPVVRSFFDLSGSTATPVVTVSAPIGLSMYNYWPHPGGNGVNPADYNTQNFNLQHRVAFLTDYVVQVPAVADKATYDAAPFKGLCALIGASVKPGEFVSYDKDSNFVSVGYDYGSLDGSAIIGQILTVGDNSVKDLLNLVRTRYSEFEDLEKMPGTATEGQPDSLTYSKGYGLVTINLIHR